VCASTRQPNPSCARTGESDHHSPRAPSAGRGLSGLWTLIQSREGPDRYGAASRFERTPSHRAGVQEQLGVVSSAIVIKADRGDHHELCSTLAEWAGAKRIAPECQPEPSDRMLHRYAPSPKTGLGSSKIGTKIQVFGPVEPTSVK